MKSILDADAWCDSCLWHGIVDDCIPDIDGDGNLGCPECGEIVETEKIEADDAQP